MKDVIHGQVSLFSRAGRTATLHKEGRDSSLPRGSKYRLQQNGQASSVVEDGPHTHTARLVKDLRQVTNLPISFLLTRLPDRQPNQQCVGCMHRQQTLPTHSPSLARLWQEINRVWGEMDQKIIVYAIKDMARCREDLRRAKGSAVTVQAALVVARG